MPTMQTEMPTMSTNMTDNATHANQVKQGIWNAGHLDQVNQQSKPSWQTMSAVNMPTALTKMPNMLTKSTKMPTKPTIPTEPSKMPTALTKMPTKMPTKSTKMTTKMNCANQVSWQCKSHCLSQPTKPTMSSRHPTFERVSTKAKQVSQSGHKGRPSWGWEILPQSSLT